VCVGAVFKFGGSVMSAMRHMNNMMKHSGRGRPGFLRVTVGQSSNADILSS
jgi:hypothetical protein